ncbi:MAG: ketol-acid reductoisomerase [Candidatus Binatia bacterium]
MPKVHREADASLEPLAGKTVAVLGYGNQGRSQALNLRDSGVSVIVGNREDEYASIARADGFEPRSIADAAKAADVALLLIPDEVQAEVYAGEIAPHLHGGDVLCFAHGYNIAFGILRAAKDLDIVMVAPRMIGAGVRERFVAGEGFPSFVGVHQDASGEAEARMLAIAKGIGSTRAGCLEMSLADEAALDLFTEQAFGPAFGAAMRAAMETLVEAGFPPEAVLLELYMSGELATSLAKAAEMGMVEQWNLHSHTSQYGSMTRGARFADLDLKERMTAILGEIRSGEFAKEWQAEQANGLPIFKMVKEMVRETPMVVWEAATRAMFGAPKKR